MPRAARVVAPGAPHHVTQRGNHQENVFSSAQDRRVYLELLREHCEKAELAVVGFCLMSNHIHLVVVPAHEAAMAEAIGRTHFRYTNYYQARRRRSGHLWQNRFYSCPMSESHLVKAMLDVEQNPVRAGMVAEAVEWRWSSARFHTGEGDEFGLLEPGWAERFSGRQWRELLVAAGAREEARRRERCTYAGKPYGEESFVEELSERFGRCLALRGPGRPPQTKHAGAGK